MHNFNIVGVIPARGGSKGIKRKNCKLLNGKPLIVYTIEEAKKSNLEHIVVSTDDKEIADISTNHGIQVIMRPEALAQDSTPTLPVLQHVMKQLNKHFDSVMTLQPTSPLRTSFHINDAINIFNADPTADSLVSVIQIPHNMSPVSIMKMQNSYLVNYLESGKNVLRRQDKPVYYARNGAAIYITKTERLNEYIFGGKILPYIMNKTDSLDIDDMDDWNLAELLLRNQK